MAQPALALGRQNIPPEYHGLSIYPGATKRRDDGSGKARGAARHVRGKTRLAMFKLARIDDFGLASRGSNGGVVLPVGDAAGRTTKVFIGLGGPRVRYVSLGCFP